MNPYTLGSYVDCSYLTSDQVSKLLDKWKNMLGELCNDVDDVSSRLSYLVFYKNVFLGHCLIFAEDNRYCLHELTYDDFFPNEVEAEVERPKTIDLERKVERELFDSIRISDYKTLDSLYEKLYDIHTGNGSEPLDIELSDDHLEFFSRVEEPEEDYLARVAREKQLNDWYNQQIRKVMIENLKLKKQLDKLKQGEGEDVLQT